MTQKLDKWDAVIYLALCLFLATMCAIAGVCLMGGCATLTPDSVRAMANIEARAVVKAEVTGVSARVGTMEARVGKIESHVGGTNDNITTWLAVAGGPACVLAYIFVWRPIALPFRKAKMNGGK